MTYPKVTVSYIEKVAKLPPTTDAKKSDYKARASDDEVRAYIPLDRIAYWTATN
jgi:hypothetical protein